MRVRDISASIERKPSHRQTLSVLRRCSQFESLSGVLIVGCPGQRTWHPGCTRRWASLAQAQAKFAKEEGGIMAKGGTVQQKSQLDVHTPTTEEQVRIRAYQIWVERGGEGGSELDDWLRAEEEILCAQEIA
jgi:hypothetical protein